MTAEFRPTIVWHDQLTLSAGSSWASIRTPNATVLTARGAAELGALRSSLQELLTGAVAGHRVRLSETATGEVSANRALVGIYWDSVRDKGWNSVRASNLHDLCSWLSGAAGEQPGDCPLSCVKADDGARLFLEPLAFVPLTRERLEAFYRLVLHLCQADPVRWEKDLRFTSFGSDCLFHAGKATLYISRAGDHYEISANTVAPVKINRSNLAQLAGTIAATLERLTETP